MAGHRIYDKGYAGDTVRVHDNWFMGKTDPFLVRRVHDFAETAGREDLCIVEVGCGGGALTHRIAQTDERWSVLGIDINPDALGAGQATPNARFAVADGSMLPLRDGTVDVVVSAHTLEHVPETLVRGVFAEIGRCLVLGGECHTIVPFEPGPLRGVFNMGMARRSLQRAGLPWANPVRLLQHSRELHCSPHTAGLVREWAQGTGLELAEWKVVWLNWPARYYMLRKVCRPAAGRLD
ncbi:MAG TPA: hypothetical protein DGT21_22675 [Armatimonadetes bacterium]|nr:hypothetical protein [Armatimonadota bacterium]